MSNIEGHYNSESIEEKWYAHWREQGYFHSEPDEREPYSIVIPPPNVTGVLHMGHMLNNTIQDILIRKARKDGKNACWVPGTDHASIATEAKVVKMLREEGIKKSDLTREEFLERAFEWKDKYGGIILKQLEKLGASCDWDRTAFTMDDVRSSAVIKAFVDLYNAGKLYRKKRMVNWDPEAKTVLSNEEVLYAEENRKLYHVKYTIEGTEESVIVATTRPETIMGDTAIAVHPEDERYAHLKGKKAIVPMVDRAVPIIFDDYVELDFGTGALKVTPAHDMNDYEIGQRHNLEVIDILEDDGSLNENAQVFVGEDRFKARKLVVKKLEEIGQLVSIEDYRSNVGRSERTNSIVEPKLSLQWYVDMKSLAEPALKAVESDEVEFFPKNQKNLYRHWMENIRDWCISRQLWWGHRIPAFYVEDQVFVAETLESAQEMASNHFGRPIELEAIRQDEDVLDTWFSSWLWPISVFDGFKNQKEIDYYYPTSTLVTGWDIIFLWVARMVMAGYEWKQERPFKSVYFTGMVRDKKRRKMSKSLGNSPDALKLIETYGADGVRFGMMSCSPAGGDLLFDEKLCENGKNFCNKIWNATKLINSWEQDVSLEMPSKNRIAIEWIEGKLNQTLEDIEQNFNSFRLSDSIMKLHGLIWSDFCSWFLEIIKPDYQAPIDSETVVEAQRILGKLMHALHPFMPFISEEIIHVLEPDAVDACVAPYPAIEEYDSALLNQFNAIQALVTHTREVRNKAGLKKSEKIKLFFEKASDTVLKDHAGFTQIVCQLTNAESVASITAETDTNGLVAFLSGTTKYFAQIEKSIDVEEEVTKIKDEIKRLEGFLKGIEKKLSNESFVNNAPEVVVNKEKQKKLDSETRIKILTENLNSLLNR